MMLSYCVISFTCEKKKEKKIFSLVYRIHFSLDKTRGKSEAEKEMRWIVATHTTRSSHTFNDSAKVEYYSNKSK
jgi:hypothetical protein